MKATWAFGPSTRSPSTKAWPSLGAVRPEPMLSNVDLPQPLGPISDTTSPSRTAMLTPSTAVRWPAPCAKRIVTLRYSSRIGSGIASFQPLVGLRDAYSRPRLSSIVANECADSPSAPKRQPSGREYDDRNFTPPFRRHRRRFGRGPDHGTRGAGAV